jgi:hypothetical protein
VEVLRGTDPLEITPPATVHVPGSVPTIQQALSLAMLGDEIIIAPGTYTENVIFCGADVVLRSSGPDGPAIVASTILDGDALGPVVTFIGFETEACVLSGFTIRNGNAVRGGGIFGGIAFRSATRATIEKNVITGNTATSRWWETAAGGGLFNCNGLVRNNTIAGNSASARNGGSGGGLHSCNGTIESNTISDNSASEAGGGLSGCNGLVRNNTITRNSASGQFGGSGGGLFRCGGTIQNCIIWGNTAATGAQLLESSAPTYSCIQNWTSGGEWNIALDPRFANLAGDDYRLLGDSPCIDAGKNEDWMWQAVDLDGNPRLWRGKISLTVDMGAYEYGSFPFKVVGVATGEGGEAQLTWTSRPGHTYGIWSCVDLLTGSWIEEATISSGGETTTWADTDTISMRKFYRAEQLK